MKSQESEIHRQERQQHPAVAQVSKVVAEEGEFHPLAELLRRLRTAPKAAVAAEEGEFHPLAELLRCLRAAPKAAVAAAEGEFHPQGLLLIFE
jgi:enoyl-CoA hydratase/carnithine racemase